MTDLTDLNYIELVVRKPTNMKTTEKKNLGPTYYAGKRFDLGMICITPGAQALDRIDVATAIMRHARGDWGTVDEHDRQANDQSLRDGSRLLSAYESDGTKFWLITEADRSATTILLPEEY